MRRIVTAREQAEMTTPWRREAGNGLRFEVNHDVRQDPVYGGGISQLRAHDASGLVGILEWKPNGEVHHVGVPKDRRREGIASEMFNWARENAHPDLHHSEAQTPDGAAWAARTAAPWHSQPGDPTYQIPTGDLLKHRQFNPSPQTPEDMYNTLYTTPWGKDEQPYRKPGDTDWSSGGGDEGSRNADSIVDAFESGHADKLPPVEISTNGVGATLTDGNHRAETADMMSQPELSSYIHYDPHGQMDDDDFESAVDPNSALGKHVHQLVQNHPYEPLGDNAPSTRYVFRQHPDTGQWQRGRVDHHSPAQYVDDDDYAQQMKDNTPGYKHDGLGTYYDVDWGNGGNELTHQRHLYARVAMSPMEPHGDASAPRPEHPDGPNGMWHGSPSGDLRGGAYGLHIGTYDAAKEALEARIGKPADGRSWDGTRVYGETPLARHGYGYGADAEDGALPSGKAMYSDGTPVAMDSRPHIFPVRITGPMSNTPQTPHPDFKANGYMKAQITKGNAKRGYYYTNEGEGVSVDPHTGKTQYSLSAVVPHGGHLEVLK